MLGGGITLNHAYEFDAEGDTTVLRHNFSAFGPISVEMAEGIEGHASLESFEPQLRSWIERGEVIPPPEL
jgi:recombinational DNA repair protein RecT